MNYYIVVEDKYSPKVFREWITNLNSELSEVKYPTQIRNNNFYFSRGYGYPQYLVILPLEIQTAIIMSNVDFFLVCIDSEDMTYENKYQEINDILKPFQNQINYRIIVQHFCLETWALGNQALIKKNPQSSDYLNYLRHYDVSLRDPEILPTYGNMNRSQFAYSFLKAACQEKYCPYTKSNPSTIAHPTFFRRLIERRNNTGHISSFQYFLDAFS